MGRWRNARASYAQVAAVGACLVIGLLAPANRVGAEVPLDGYFPLVGIGLSNEFDDNFNFFPSATAGVAESDLLGPAGPPTYDLALLDTGAGFSVLTSQAFDDFNLDGPYSGEPEGYNGTEVVQIGGATGTLFAPINDPFGLYVGGFQDRTADGAALGFNSTTMNGQTNTATITLPPDSSLPNIIGLPWASQYATQILNDQPQVFELGGKTIRSPAINFLPLGSGGNGITRKAPLNLNPGATFAQPPAYLPNIINFDINNPQENPSSPTLMQGALFLNVEAENNGNDLGGATEFFFDTGASVTVLSELNALNLGFDVTTDEPEFTISVVGSGGVLSDVPGFFVEEFTIVALGGNVTAQNVPVIVLDVADPSDPGNVVEGIVGTNLLSGRNVVIDPNPSLGGGGESAGVYISDPVTTDSSWTSPAEFAAWADTNSWDAAAIPDLLSSAKLAPNTTGDQTAVVVGDQLAWDLSVAGGPNGTEMTVWLVNGSSLTTFSGASLTGGATARLDNAVFDTQYLDIRGGTLAGSGEVRTGSGPIIGQVEILEGSIDPSELLTIDGRLAFGEEAELSIEVGGPVTDQLHATADVGLRGGKLVVTLADGYLPSANDQFTLVSSDDLIAGQFDLLQLPAGYLWDVVYNPTSVVLAYLGEGIDGDFNADGVVDAADYTVWRDGLGTIYTQSDYDTWASNYGATAPATTSSVPEPSAMVLMGLALTAPRRTGSRSVRRPRA